MRRLLALGTVACALAVSFASWAKEPMGYHAPVSVGGCDWLDPVVLVRLTQVEMALAMTGQERLTVDVACVESTIRIRIVNPNTAARVERRCGKACYGAVDPERTVALLTAGLYRAARPTLLGLSKRATASGPTASTPSSTPSEEPQPPLPTAPTAEHSPPVRLPFDLGVSPVALPHDTLSTPSVDSDGTDRIHELSFSGGARFFNLAEPLPTPSFALHYRNWPFPVIGFGACFAAHLGRTSRTGGDVDVRSFDLNAVAAWRAFPDGPFRFGIELSGGASIVQLAGVPASETYPSETLTGLTGNIGAALLPSIDSGPLEFGLGLGVGYLFRAPRGLVQGGSPVQLDGLWVASEIVVSGSWGERADPQNIASRKVP